MVVSKEAKEAVGGVNDYQIGKKEIDKIKIAKIRNSKKTY